MSSARSAPPYSLLCIFHSHCTPSTWWGYLTVSFRANWRGTGFSSNACLFRCDPSVSHPRRSYLKTLRWIGGLDLNQHPQAYVRHFLPLSVCHPSSLSRLRDFFPLSERKNDLPEKGCDCFLTNSKWVHTTFPPNAIISPRVVVWSSGLPRIWWDSIFVAKQPCTK